MTTISSQMATYTQTATSNNTPAQPSATAAASDASQATVASAQPSAQVPDITSIKAAASNSGSYSFDVVTQNARAVLDDGIKKLGKQPDIYTNTDQWIQIFGGMDRRSLYAVASNQGGQFITQEQQIAQYTMGQQVSQAIGNAATGSAKDDAAALQRGITFLQDVSPEEKLSIGWASGMASAMTGYNAEASEAGLPAQSYDGTNPLVKVLMAAMKAAQSDPAKDKTTGQTNTLAGILDQPWAQGFETQITSAYASLNPQGSLVDTKA
jgi:hypothetical protein